MRSNWDFSACPSLWLFLPTYCAVDHLEGIMLATEKAP